MPSEHFLGPSGPDSIQAASPDRIRRVDPSARGLRIAVVGSACRLPGADSPEALWEMLKAQRTGISKATDERYRTMRIGAARVAEARRLGLDLGGFIEDIDCFDPTLFGISFGEAASMDPQQRVLLEVTWSALENAGIAPGRLAGTRTGVFLGIGSYDYSIQQAGLDPFGKRITPYTALGNAHSIAANRISYAFDLKGPSLAVDTACSSSSYALHYALRSLSSGECDTAIVAGVHLIMSMNVTRAFSMAHLLARDGNCKVFDAAADGYVRAEGCVVMVLKRLEDAIAANDRPLGVIVGSAVNQDGRTEGITLPSGDMQAAAISAALTEAGLHQSAISYVEGHGTGTKRGDTIELSALASVFRGDRANPCHVRSITANLGHLEPVRGLAGLLKTMLCLEHEEIPGQANLTTPNEAAEAEGTRIVVAGETVPWPRGRVPRRASVSCFGFGGANSHIVIEEPPVLRRERRSDGERPVHLLKISTRKPEQLAEAALRLSATLRGDAAIGLADACHAANVGRADLSERVLIEARTREELVAGLDAVAEGRSAANVVRGTSRKARRRTAFLLTGAGSQYSGMGKALLRTAPAFAKIIGEADEILRACADFSLIELLYGKHPRNAHKIDEPRFAEPAVLAVDLALARLWMSWGVEPELLLGHGIGEAVAAVLDGEMSFEEALRLVVRRGGEPLHDGERIGLVQGAGRRPGRLRDSIEAILAAGVDTIIEVGAQPVMLSSLAEEIGGRDVVAVASLAKGRDDWDALTESLASLYCRGVAIDWTGWDAPYGRERPLLPNYPFVRERFWHITGPVDGEAEPTPTPAERPDGGASPATNGAQSVGAAGSGQATQDASATVFRLGAGGDDRTEVLDIVRRNVSKVTAIPVDQLAEHTLFREIGFDSIMGLELMLRLDSTFGVVPQRDDVGEETSIGDLVDVMLGAMKTAAPREAGIAAEQVVGSVPVVSVAPAAIAAKRVAPGDASRLNGAPRPAEPAPAPSEPNRPAASDVAPQLSTADYCDTIRPDFAGAVRSLALDVDYYWAEGDRVRGRIQGAEVEAIDMLGGYGATLFGHNHPALVAVMQDALAAKRPQFVQMSNRTAAGTLARELGRQVGVLTGDDYIGVLGSTGAEIVDAAIKHVLMEWVARRRAWLDAQGASATPVGDVAPVLLAVEGSYHGKTLGAYAVTWNAPGRAEIGLEGPFDVVWLKRGDASDVRRAFEENWVEPRDGGAAGRWNRIAGVFVEPVQGEGGIFALPREFLTAIREQADAAGCPVVVDEIQSGLGRCGNLLASSLLGLKGDHYLFGKALGGGLTKSAALLVSAARYQTGFGFVHTSTYGEDDHSALVGLRALKLIEEDRLAARAAEAGAYVLERLGELRTKYPGVIADVRGQGLMIGVELAEQADNSSSLIRGLTRQSLLAVIVTGCLLHKHGIRVGTTLSRPSTLRLEPSAYVSRRDLDAVVGALADVCRIISTGAAGELTGHLARIETPLGSSRYQVRREMPRPEQASASGAVDPLHRGTAVFLGHMIDADDIGQWDASLMSLDREGRERLAKRIAHPIAVMRTPIRAETAETVEFAVHSLGVTSPVIERAFRSGDRDGIVTLVNNAIGNFAQNGVRVVGLGGLLSVVTANGLDVVKRHPSLIVTTGNTYTVALSIEAVLKAMAECGIDPAGTRLGVVGAGGNIGSTLVRVLADRFMRLKLVGRKANLSRVERTAEKIYEDAWQRWAADGARAGGIAAALAETGVLSGLSPAGNGAAPPGETGARVRAALIEKYGRDPLIAITDGIENLYDCPVIITASNSTEPIFRTDNVGPDLRLLCDISVPSDVDPQLIAARPDVKVIRGGVARAPNGARFTVQSAGLPEGHLLACMAETAILGLAGASGYPTTGEITPDGVRASAALGQKYGFSLGYTASNKLFSVGAK